MNDSEIIAKNRDVINTLIKERGDFHAVLTIGQKWKLASELLQNSPDYMQINHREVLPSEIVIDFDTKDEDKLKRYYGELRKRMHAWKIPYTSYTTGGKGIHVHIFNDAVAKEPVETRPLLKKIFIDQLFLHGTQNWAVHGGVDYQLCSRHLVRSEYGMHEKTGRDKMPLHTFKTSYYDSNRLPPKVGLALIEEKSRLREQKKQFSNVSYTGTGLKGVEYPCIQYLISQDFAGMKDGRKRALPILCSYFYSTYGEKGFQEVLQWNEYKLNLYFTEEKVLNTWKGIKKMVEGGKRYGFRSIRNLLQELGLNEQQINELCTIR